MSTETLGASDDSNIVPLEAPKVAPVPAQRKTHDEQRQRWAKGFFELEEHICDLVRIADLAQFVFNEEVMSGNRISDDGSTLALVLDDLVERVKGLRQIYYDFYRGSELA